MVEAGVRILGSVPSSQRPVVSEEGKALTQNTANAPDSGAHADGKSAQPGMAVPQEVASRYREFERATNAELEKSVGGTIARAMETALPNLRHANGSGREWPLDSRGKQASSLQERLMTAVREDVEVALKSDASLGEQVARVLSGRRFDEGARAQVVRLIDARPQQLVPGAVRRVVGAWTQATLGGRKSDVSVEERRVERTASPSRTPDREQTANRSERSAPGRGWQPGRVDYRKMSDEQILGM